jgi:hypothetical protein
MATEYVVVDVVKFPGYSSFMADGDMFINCIVFVVVGVITFVLVDVPPVTTTLNAVDNSAKYGMK